ncbi:hypothetical protein [Aquisalinus flavus]|uniref:Endonuclease n=1 Tax=Aquisalinus flavus TaxID=1526572 RepID=A0A8J2V195_9PROT|nr:hypothetical protein [Aquisalinus flavus]MBD0426690.1 hypothetical protein [Aquisalinus flavus]UNE46560.1 hypothetical protein FF099_00005 [Aquisalinus flavus]GGC95186.1 hypothetical protein GCM10011342_00010 [Aquisalinus flavus]
MGVTTYSLQNHWRTTYGEGIQVEIDEIYAGIDSDGKHYVIPVQAKTGKDEIGVVQSIQDHECCKEKFPGLPVRAISAQFASDDVIAMFEVVIDNYEMKISRERHYKLVPRDDLD